MIEFNKFKKFGGRSAHPTVLRNFSKSAEQTNAKWTIDIPLYQNQKGMQIYKGLKFK